MHIISHRGNLNGPSSRENEPKYISEALNQGFEVEVDLWAKNGLFFLGHDLLQYEVDLTFLRKQWLWIHCKNLAALQAMSEYKQINCFAHKKDDFVLSSHGFIMLPPHMGYARNCITMMPEVISALPIPADCGGVITDFPIKYL